MTRLQNKIFPALSFCLLFGAALMLTGSNLKIHGKLSDVLQEILLKLQTFNAKTPEDKVYIHQDKTFYKPGETVWFSVYVRNGKDLRPSAQSDIVHVEIINPKGSIEKSLKIITKDGVAQGDYFLDENLSGGIYKIKAYTEWMKNDPSPAIFEKEFTVQKVVLPRLKMKLDFQKDAYGPGAEAMADLTLNTNENKPLANQSFSYNVNLDGNSILKEKGVTNEEGAAVVRFRLPQTLSSNDGLLNVLIEYQGQTEAISRSVPIVLNDISVNFYPEGGDMVENMPATVAFSAKDEFGKPADVQGYITNKKGEVVARFESYHKGMGAFSFTPQPSESYTAHLTQPQDITQEYTLPEALPRGYGLHIQKTENEQIIVTVHSTENEALSIVATVHGQQYFAHSFQAGKGTNNLTIPTQSMPVGITQLTLFDSKGIPRSERLAFVNKHKKLQITLSTDKEKYLPREKVNVTVTVKDERGMPMPANLSLSVVNDQLLSFADDKSSNILSWLLVEGELKEKVEEPNFYFDEKEDAAKRDLALEYLLMTSGWRRYGWKEVLGTQPPVISYNAEKAEIGGIIYDDSGKPVKGAEVVLGNQNVQTGENGRFMMKGVVLTNPVYLTVKDKNDRMSSIYVPSYGNQFSGYLYDNTLELATTTEAVVVRKNRPVALPKKVAMNRAEDVPVNQQMAVMAAPAMPAPPMGEAAPVVMGKIQENEKKGDVAIIHDLPVIEEKTKSKEVLADKADGVVMDFRAQEHKPVFIPNQAPSTQYYIARQFASPDYIHSAEPPKGSPRTDFRSTLYWNGNVVTDRTGKTTVSFFASDEITSFRITTEGIAVDGMPGRAEKTFFTQLPFSLSAKLPVEVITEDVIKIPVTLVNNSDKALTGTLTVNTPEGLTLVKALPEEVSIEAKQAKTLYLAYNVVNTKGKGNIAVRFSGKGFEDETEQPFTIIPKGFPVSIALSGSSDSKTFEVNIMKPVMNSQTVTFTAFPSTVNELLKGLEGMLSEPYGCFEQTSSSTYPNILVLQYLQETGEAKPDVSKRAKELIERGYGRLAGYESKSGGFEWFGGDPGHEGLTAYGLMEFMDMQKVWDGVDAKMVKRTVDWLMSRKDGKGGFQRNPNALHEFGLADKTTMDTYIVWALSEFRQQGLEKEIASAYQKALETQNPYQLGLIANTMYNYNSKKEAEKALSQLVNIQNEAGVWKHGANERSAPGSGGQGLAIETASLALLAMMKAENPDMSNIRKLAEFLRNSRNGNGSFSNTNATVLALKALVRYAQFTKRTDESGKIEIYVDGKKAGEQSYDKGEQNPIVIEGLESYFSEGKKSVTVKYIGVKNPLPYTLSIKYYTALPNSNPECVVKLETKLAAKQVKVGETVRLTTNITNQSAEGQPMTMVIVGLPAGLSAQPWQLKELQDKKVFDFYEISGNNLFLYYRQMKPSESLKVNLDLKAELAGTYEAPASCGYLYYTNEYKHWTNMDRITITE
ncbi:MAG: hypothetical protein K1X92_16935 [Bacteroidia bacterium]|nr:hypothetical protein [Bacteroidia bacterium]